MASRKCPNCGSNEVIPVIFGDPKPESIEGERRGEVLLLGCNIPLERPRWYCRDCEHLLLTLKKSLGKI